MRHEKLFLESVPSHERTVEICVAALRQYQSTECFALIPKEIKQIVKQRAGCYDFHAPGNRYISSIYNKG
ncbi:MAG: hypothetical protein LBV68_01040 [Spirochaetaceae bacterium]|jgi:hypothetical protein|nr:hypothetical protein [Spirochaetaceae bacterium]